MGMDGLAEFESAVSSRVNVVTSLSAVAIWAEDLEVGTVAATAFTARGDVVDVKKAVFSGVQAAELACPADIAEGEVQEAIELVEAVEDFFGKFTVIGWEAKGVDSEGAVCTCARVF